MVKVGQRVAIPTHLFCGLCLNCARGYSAACLRVRPGGLGAAYGYVGMGPYRGAQAELLRVPFADANCVPLPGEPGDLREDDFVLLANAFVTGWHATELAKVRPGGTVAVFGAGAVGLLAGYSAVLKGAAEVYLVDRVPERLALAAELGATAVDFTGGDPVEQIKELRRQRGLPLGEEARGGVESAIDAVGFQAVDRLDPSREDPKGVIADLARLVNPTGQIGIAGVYAEKDLHPAPGGHSDGRLEVPWATLFSKGVQLGFGRTHDRRYTTLLRDLIVSGKARPGPAGSSRITRPWRRRPPCTGPSTAAAWGWSRRCCIREPLGGSGIGNETPSAERRWAEELDRRDPLAHFRGRFQLPGDQLIYLDGNSLGMLPREALARLTQVAQGQWGDRLIRSWAESWLEAPSRVGDLLGLELLGAQAGEVVVTDSVSVNLYKLISAALDARPGRRRIVSERAIFPTDRYILEGVAKARGLELILLEVGDGQALTVEEVAPAVDQSTALLLLSHVDYRSAAVTEMAPMNQIASRAGALTLWDLCHSVGVIPVSLEDSGADLAVGCTYKYLNSGPGAPAFLYVRRRHQKLLRQPIWGWFGQSDQFAMEELYQPPESISRFQVGTPNILGTALVQVGVELIVEAGLERVHAKALGLTELARSLHQQWLFELGYGFASPEDPARRGAHVSLRHPSALALCAELGDHRVVVDHRPPDLIRFGLSPLTTRFIDVWDALDTLRQFGRRG